MFEKASLPCWPIWDASDSSSSKGQNLHFDHPLHAKVVNWLKIRENTIRDSERERDRGYKRGIDYNFSKEMNSFTKKCNPKSCERTGPNKNASIFDN